jgi:hypothetical protein
VQVHTSLYCPFDFWSDPVPHSPACSAVSFPTSSSSSAAPSSPRATASKSPTSRPLPHKPRARSSLSPPRPCSCPPPTTPLSRDRLRTKAVSTDSSRSCSSAGALPSYVVVKRSVDLRLSDDQVLVIVYAAYLLFQANPPLLARLIMVSPSPTAQDARFPLCL